MASSEQLRALNDEVVALRQMGIPLDLVLPPQERELESSLQQLQADIDRRMSQGGTSSPGESGSPLRAVEVGLRCGRLPIAVEGIGQHASCVYELRQQLGVLLLYPLLVAGLAYLLVVLLSLTYLPGFLETQEVMRVRSSWVGQGMVWVHATLPFWLALPPVIAVGGTIYLGWRSTDPKRHSPWTVPPPLSWFPGFQRLVNDAQLATVSWLLAELLAHGVPRDEALGLAVAAVGDKSIAPDRGRRVDGTGRASQSTGNSSNRLPREEWLPPLLHWAWASPQDDATRVPTLRLASHFYQQRANLQRDRLRVQLPTAACLLVSSGAVFLYVMLFWVPLCDLLIRLSEPSTGPGVF